MPSTCRKRRLKRLSWKGIQFCKTLASIPWMFSVVGGEGRLVSGVCAEGDGVRKWDVGCGGGGCGTTGRAGVVGWMSGVSLGQWGGGMTG